MCLFAAERKRREQQAEIAAAPAATAYPPPYGVPLPVSTLLVWHSLMMIPSLQP